MEDALGGAVSGYRAVSGGCIANALRVDDAGGPRAFLKWSPADDPASATFRAEREGLAALAEAGVVRVPRVLGLLETPAATGLLLEWLDPAAPAPGAWRALGSRLARLHRAPAAAEAGWPADNYIGPLPQANAPAGSWAGFWRSRRLLPQVERAAGTLGSLAARVDALADRLPELLEGAEEDGLSLLHGDLWSGNVHFTPAALAGRSEDGDRVAADVQFADPEAALIDPSVYVGHREVDLAMATLFGGFPRPFDQGYRAEWPLAGGWARRRPVYQLYYLLVHVNLFGASYLQGVARALERVGG